MRTAALDRILNILTQKVIRFLFCSFPFHSSRIVSGQMRTELPDRNSSRPNFEFLVSEAQKFTFQFCSFHVARVEAFKALEISMVK